MIDLGRPLHAFDAAKITGNKVEVDLDGGTLVINYTNKGVWMNGPTMHVFNGQLNSQFLDSI